MIRGLLILLIVVSYAAPLHAQDDDDYRLNRRDRSGGIVGGGGGIVPTWLFLDASRLNSELSDKGLPTVGEQGLFLFGGHGHAYIMFIPNLRIGGMGMGGSMETRRDQGGLYQSTKLDIGVGGMTIEYVIPFGAFHIALGGLIGGGRYSLTLTQTDNTGKTWGTLFPETPLAAVDSRHELVNSFLALQPTLTMEYELHPFIVLGLVAGYFATAGESWKLDDNFEISEMPDFKMNGAFARLQLTMGLFLSDR